MNIAERVLLRVVMYLATVIIGVTAVLLFVFAGIGWILAIMTYSEGYYLYGTGVLLMWIVSIATIQELQ